MTEKQKTDIQEFIYIDLKLIVVEDQIRSRIDVESESFNALVESIKNYGILEPVLVTQKDGQLVLLCGERRCLAAQKLKLTAVPARIVKTTKEKDEILAFQLTENLQREDINAMDLAKGILSFIQLRHPDKEYGVDGVIAALVNYNRRPEDLPKKVANTVLAITNISGKSIQSLYRAISLLKLPNEMQAAIRQDKLPVSQGYILAANLDCPDLTKIFESIMERPVTNETLSQLLSEYKKDKQKPQSIKQIPMKKQVATLRSTRSYIEKGTWQYTKQDLDTLIEELRTFLSLVEHKAETAPLTIPKPAKDKKIKKETSKE